MVYTDFFSPKYDFNIASGTVSWKAPSNIALVKYWGKLEGQIPANPSVSFTLTNCYTETSVRFKKLETPTDDFQFTFFFEKEPKPSFHPKIIIFFNRIYEYLPFLKDYHFEIYSENSFPHSSGIASSASAMAALSVCLMQIERQLNPNISENDFWQKASLLARLGSGSACRSIQGNIVVWGEHKSIPQSSDLYGVPYPFEINNVFKNYQDTILLIDKGQKQVSSSVGHDLMHNHPFAQKRFEQAHENLNKLIPVFRDGDLDKFIEIVESEALTLHAMMMTSLPYFILMKPNTLEVIQRIWKFRQETKTPVCFTLDAGANVHVLYPDSHKNEVLQFIKDELIAFCENKQYICDQISNSSN
ncbi:Mevalonate (Diphospho)decarboxylase [Capnocytophaga canimorsus]|uniref:Mevalonate (Diphospho)decarboxylase n=1 Tax=Capnocytophaga canimorsus TaxID=28188 RepID=A0A0B7HLG9_9FLAO|nr:diphosphomevalonate decarboxylase [Capnocytophaga canimorsus]ATA76695.1 diphosphomevalonate decarboxylase [Capnocytophaga canimorsus]PJI84195.1 diphosphomevalonate decarboxylase [Capnocytophaga canimorsus]CEN40601.1 Mevalonate (Diphospho)decarboxylase [Capnocytophaga canimorsus]STA71876.1 Mevalonate pyrophosphate decarboxylase [Capnocytophaga canimorsus]